MVEVVWLEVEEEDICHPSEEGREGTMEDPEDIEEEVYLQFKKRII